MSSDVQAPFQRSATPEQRDVILVAFPHQLLHALAALQEARRTLIGQAEEPIMVFVWCYDAAQHRRDSRFRQLFKRLLAKFPHVQLVFPGFIRRKLALTGLRPIRDRKAAIRRAVGLHEVRILAYSHDMGADHTAQAMLQAWPHALALCYGDPPGYLYTREEVERARVPPSSILRYFLALGRRPDDNMSWRHAERSIVALPLTVGTGRPQDIQVERIPVQTLRGTLQRLQQGLGDIPSEQALIASLADGQRTCLLLLSNFTESGISERENELRLYARLITSHALRGQKVWIKPHAGTDPAFLRRIQQAVPDRQVEVLPDALAWLPVEMLGALLGRVRVVSVSSASALLALLMDPAHIVHGLTPELVDEFLDSRWHDYFHGANAAIVQAMREAASPSS